MKASCTLVASVLAASTAAIGSTSAYADHGRSLCNVSCEERLSNPKVKKVAYNSSEKDKFAPRFDGLRFIETLVTAHR